MIVNHIPNIAIFDPSLAEARKAHPFATEDSCHSVDDYGMLIQRGNGDRVVGYFKIDPKFASLPSQYHLLTIQYQDDGLGDWFIEYIPMGGTKNSTYPWLATERVSLNNSGRKKEVCLRIDKARLTGAANGADFRIIYVDSERPEFRLYSLRMIVGESGLPAYKSQFLRPSRSLEISFDQVAKPQVSIVIPVFNNLDYTVDCLRAIAEFTSASYEVIVVDNASTDQTAQSLASINSIRVITNRENIGFAKACNQAANEARGEYIVFLNNDTLPQPGWLSSMLACAQRRRNIGVVGSRLIFPQTDEIQSAGVSFGKYLLPVEQHQHCSVDDPEVCHDREVEALSGACMLVKQSVFKSMSGFDESFLNGFEDIDLCLRLGIHDYINVVCATSNVLHYQSATEGRFDLEKDRSNIALFHKKWHSYLSGVTKAGDHSNVSLDKLPRHIAADFIDINHQTGQRDDGVIQCFRTKDAPGHCVYGPYLRFADSFDASVTFDLHIDDLTEKSGDIISLDVYDSVGNQVLTEKTLRLQDVETGKLAPVLYFASNTTQILEFRVYWHGNCHLIFSGLTINTAA